MVARAHAALTLQPNDRVVKVPWPWPHGMPASRWVQRTIGAFGRAEFGALMLLIQLRWQDTVEAWASAGTEEEGKALAIELDQQWQGIDLPLARRCPRPPYLNDVHDADLIALALGSVQSPCPSGPARVRLMEYMREADIRDVIRGCARDLHNVTSGKAPPGGTWH